MKKRHSSARGKAVQYLNVKLAILAPHARLHNWSGNDFSPFWRWVLITPVFSWRTTQHTKLLLKFCVNFTFPRNCRWEPLKVWCAHPFLKQEAVQFLKVYSIPHQKKTLEMIPMWVFDVSLSWVSCKSLLVSSNRLGLVLLNHVQKQLVHIGSFFKFSTTQKKKLDYSIFSPSKKWTHKYAHPETLKNLTNMAIHLGEQSWGFNIT